MVDISSQNNKINISVSSSGNTANTNVTPDSAMYYSNKSKEWAISNRIVDNTDYSSKYYANESKKQADISTVKATEVIESGNTAVSNIENARDNAIINVNTAGATQVANVNSAGTTQINLAKEQVTLATNQANIATEQATIATNKTSEVVASGNTALSNIDTAKNNAITTITTQETTSKNNVIATGNEQVARIEATGNNYDNLTHRNITNCLLEVPQRIKLELNDGVLTLKAGSQVIVPNGFGADGKTPKFDYVTIESDISITANSNNVHLIGYKKDKKNLYIWNLSDCYSGSTQPSANYALWYDTTTNLVKEKVNGTWLTTIPTLPICIVTTNTTQIASIDQVFNGMGYIGSTVWVDKGVKGLIPNGRNEDGTLKNIEYTTPKLRIRTWSYQSINQPLFISRDGLDIPSGGAYYVSDAEPVSPTLSWVMWYNPRENIMRYSNDNDKWTVNNEWLFTGIYTSSDTAQNNYKITQFANPKLPFRAVDYNDFSEQLANKADISTPSIQAPYIKDTYVNGTSGYRIWSDGYCEQWGNIPFTATGGWVSGTITFLKPFKDTNYYINGRGNWSERQSCGFGLNSKTTTAVNVTVAINTLTSENGAWRACGYLAEGKY